MARSNGLIATLARGVKQAGQRSPCSSRSACTAENEGEYAMTSEYSLLYVEYATYVCTDSARELLIVSRCYYLVGRCTPL